MEVQLKNMTRPGSRTSILGSPTSESGNLGNRFSGLSTRGGSAFGMTSILLAMTAGVIGIAVFALGAKTASASTLPKPRIFLDGGI